ncbi:MAG: hypothetical protein E2O39_14420 [Planctomycetota bacterium]|nr:MAG: hypothetical protein E2O39_14420 [Planctomycetota bacterium]
MSSSKGITAGPLACLAAGAVLIGSTQAQVSRDFDEGVIRRALRQGAEELPGIEDRWRASLTPREGDEESWSELFGYNPPGRALELAYLFAFLYERHGHADDARTAAEYLARMARYTDEVPAELRAARVEYTGGLPPVPSFFHLADYAEAWGRIEACSALEASDRRTVEAAIAASAEFVFVFPEWGAHNRAMLRAESLLFAARALPEHEDAARWRRLAEVLAADSLGRWEIEDAQIYHPIWLLAVMRYGGSEVFDTVQVRWYLRYLLELLTPRGTLPDFGDAWWDRGGLARAYICLEWGAAELGDPELKWAAERAYTALGPFDPERPGLGRARSYALLADLIDPALVPRAPTLTSGPVLDAVIGKKVVLRGAGDFYLLLNYRDEGDWARRQRDNLRHTLAVEEEKAHHGHSDANSIVLFMHEGSVLLHEAGYRERAPSGPFGAYRADIFHNRLVARRGAPEPGQGTLAFLRNAGAYRPVRTEEIDFVAFDSFGGTDYSRTRMTDAELGYEWDRTLVFPHESELVVVVDTVRVTTPGTYTFSTLWAAQRIAARGPGYALCANDSIDGKALPANRALLVLFPDRPDTIPPTFPLRRHNQPEHVLHATRTRDYSLGELETFVTVLASVAPDTDPAELAGRIRLLPTSPAGRAVTIVLRSDEREGGPNTTICVKTDLGLGLALENVRPRYDPARGRITAGGLATDADLAIVRRQGAEARWCATNMTHVVLEGRTAFESKRLQMFQVTGRSDVVGRAKWRRWAGTLRLE